MNILKNIQRKEIKRKIRKSLKKRKQDKKIKLYPK